MLSATIVYLDQLSSSAPADNNLLVENLFQSITETTTGHEGGIRRCRVERSSWGSNISDNNKLVVYTVPASVISDKPPI